MNDEDKILQMYLREIGKIDLLNPLQEVILAKRIRKGDEDAREQMIVANLRLVVDISCNFTDMGLSRLDLISEGNIALMRAVEGFNPAKETKFSTYAVPSIRRGMRRAIDKQSKTIRIPIRHFDFLMEMQRASERLRRELSREPTYEDVAEELGVQEFIIKRAWTNHLLLRVLSLNQGIGRED